MATRHLIELGHRRIAAITGPEDMMCSLARVDGYRSAMNAANLPIDPAWIRFGDFHTAGGESARARDPRPPRPPDGDLRGQRSAGARRHRRGARDRAVRAGGPLGRGLRRHRALALDEPAAHDGAPAAAPHGRGGDPSRAADGGGPSARDPAHGPRHAPRRARAAPRRSPPEPRPAPPGMRAAHRVRGRALRPVSRAGSARRARASARASGVAFDATSAWSARV